jgi:hypothetical protein
MPNVMLEFLNTFVIKGINIYFGHKDKVYVISKQLIIDVFGACIKGYVEDLKRHVSKPLHYYKSGVQFISLNHYGTLKVK